MSYIFYGCESLFYLPDVSNWNVSNVINRLQLFYGSPIVFNWNTLNTSDINEILSDSKKLHILYNNNIIIKKRIKKRLLSYKE